MSNWCIVINPTVGLPFGIRLFELVSFEEPGRSLVHVYIMNQTRYTEAD